MRVTVRSAGIDEAHAVLSIMQVAFEEYRGRLDPPSGALSETIDDVRAAISGGGALLAFSSDMAVGSVLSSRRYETGTDVDITLSKELESSGRVDPGLPRTTSW